LSYRHVSPAKLYHYRATITAVYDGDTCTADVDLGFKLVVCGEKIRLARINAPEICAASRKAGFASRDYLHELILGEITMKQGRRNVNANDVLVSAGYAKYVEY